jgi:hypothetical protein
MKRIATIVLFSFLVCLHAKPGAQGLTDLAPKALVKVMNSDFPGCVSVEIPVTMFSDWTPVLQGRFYRILRGDEEAGFLYVGRVKTCRSGGCSIAAHNEGGESEYMDYFALISPQKKITRVVIYNYQATHGEEVTAKYWLRQFVGVSSKQQLRVGKNIDAISGATISTNSFTENIQLVLGVLDSYAK